ncbi:MAG TPA: phosphotransferase family protein [Acidimicrobiales bacterium]|nr:phosphotransferase family protein [Acidimicrobiales bacterium]
MPEIVQRDPAEVAETVARWLATHLGEAAAPEVGEVSAPMTTGFSNETIMCRATWIEGGRRADRRLVVRVAPTKHLLFLEADFSLQYRVMLTLAEGDAGVLLPPLRWFEADDSWLGAPFFLMDHVDGVVAGEPTYDCAWLVEGTPAEQERLWWSGLEAMAQVHRTDWRGLRLDWLIDQQRGPPGIEQQLAYYRDYLDWADEGRPVPVAEAAWEWLLAHRPEQHQELVLCWGDSRIGNIIWQDFTAQAVIDWEMATVGPAELDFGWWLYFDRQFSEGMVDEPRERPAGFPSREETIDRYAELLGRPLHDLFWYEVFAGFRFAVIFARLAELIKGSGLLPEDSDMGWNNIATQCVAEMLELPPPAG